jgi:hypothetical protein
MSRHRRRVPPFDPEASLPPYAYGKDYEYAFGLNVHAHSGTVTRGQWHRTDDGSKFRKPGPDIYGAALMVKARSNMVAVARAVATAAIQRWSVRIFCRIIPGIIHHGIDHASRLRAMRRHETGMDYGCPAKDVRDRWRSFKCELGTRLERHTDPVALAAWAEYEIRYGIHPLGDGCGRLATATGAWIMLLYGRRIPVYAIAERTGFHEALRQGLDEFTTLYGTLCVSTEVSEPGTPFVVATADRAVA